MNLRRLFRRGEDPPHGGSPLDLIDAIAGVLREGGGKLTRRGNVLILGPHPTRTRIEVRAQDQPFPVGAEVTDVVCIRSELPSQLVAMLDDRRMVVCNTMAALGALVRDGRSGALSVSSRLSLYDGDRDALKLYVPLIGYAALLQGSALLMAVKNTLGMESAWLGIPESDRPSQWKEQDFAFAAEGLRRIGIFSNAGAHGLTAEIPLRPGGISAIRGDATCLLTCVASMPHPALGNGLFYKLELPFQFPEESLVAVANRLNQLEVAAIDGPPFFGAWCSQLESGRIAHVGFWPNLLYQPGTVLNIAMWMVARSKLAIAAITEGEG